MNTNEGIQMEKANKRAKPFKSLC